MTLLQALQVAGCLAFAVPSSSLARAAPWSGKIGRGHAAVIPQSFITSADRAYNLSSYTAPVKGPGSATLSSSVNLTVEDTGRGHKQRITGYGAAITDATVIVFSALSPENMNALLADLFTTDTPDGVGFSLMRHTIGASDLSSYEYSYDETVHDVLVDPTLSNFTLQDPGYKMLDMIAEFKHVNPDIKLLGSVWSPPGWMKLNHVMDGNATGNTFNMTLAPSFAEYFVKYIQAFAKRNVDVDAITIQNEPLNSNPGYPTSYVSANESTELIQNYVGPALRRASLKTQIWAYDHNTDVPSYPQEVLSGAGDYVDTVAWHCYAPNNNWDVLTQFYAANPGVTQYMTECWTSPLTSWYQAADFVMGPMQNYAAGAISWTLGTDFNYNPHLPGGCNTCRGLVEVDTTAGTYSKTIDYYMIGQFSRFVPRGSIALSTTGSYDDGNGEKLEVAAFLTPDNLRTVVIQNNFGNKMYATVTFDSGETWSGQLYQESVTTWVLPPTHG